MLNKYYTTKIGTLGGSLASFISALDAKNFVISAILAVFGATISFIVSLLLKIYLKDRIKKRFKSKRKRKWHSIYLENLGIHSWVFFFSSIFQVKHLAHQYFFRNKKKKTMFEVVWRCCQVFCKKSYAVTIWKIAGFK